MSRARYRRAAAVGLAAGLVGALLASVSAGASDAETEATLLKQSPLIAAAGPENEAWMGTACYVILGAAGRAGDSPAAREPVHVVPAIVRCARLPRAILDGRGGPPATEVAALLPGSRCMALVGSRSASGEPPAFILAEPRAGSRRLGTALGTVIAIDPLREVGGYVRMLRRDGRPGWVPRNRLRPWAVASVPGLRCLPARMSDGRLDVTYALPENRQQAGTRAGQHGGWAGRRRAPGSAGTPNRFPVRGGETVATGALFSVPVPSR